MRLGTPGPYTWRRLKRLAAGAWQPTACLIAVQVNTPEKRRHPDAFNPYIDQKQTLPARPTMGITLDEAAVLLSRIMKKDE